MSTVIIKSLAVTSNSLGNVIFRVLIEKLTAKIKYSVSRAYKQMSSSIWAGGEHGVRATAGLQPYRLTSDRALLFRVIISEEA